MKQIIRNVLCFTVIALSCKGDPDHSTVPVQRSGAGKAPSSTAVNIFEIAEKGNSDALRKLLAEGADLNTRDAAGRTLLHIAAWKGNYEIANMLIEKGA